MRRRAMRRGEVEEMCEGKYGKLGRGCRTNEGMGSRSKGKLGEGE